MKKSLWITKGIFAAALAVFVQTAFAEEITVTTYYPSPEGKYETLETTGQTLLATSSGNVGIGLASGSTPSAKLEVAGDTNPLIKLVSNAGAELSRMHSDHSTNLFLGTDTGRINDASGTDSSGKQNVFVGSGAGYSNTLGHDNTTIGYNAFYSGTAYDVGGSMHAPLGNTAIGSRALYSCTIGGSNTAVGNYTLYATTTGGYNTAIGNAAMQNNTTGYSNVAIGVAALAANRIGYSNVAIGDQAGNQLIEGGQNIMIGFGAAVPSGSFQKLSIGNLIFGTGLDGAGPGAVSTGNIGIAMVNPVYRLELPNTANAKGRGRANAWVTYSSRRWKENIKPVEGALDKVQRLRGVYFDWKTGGQHDIGMIAEEVGEVVPEVVTYEKNGKDADSIDYGRLTALLVEAVKEQQKEIQSLKKEVELLKKK